PLAEEIHDLPPGQGINALVARHAARVITLEVAEPTALDDLDTPADYRRWTGADPATAPLDGTGAGNDDGTTIREGRGVHVTVRFSAPAGRRAGRGEVVRDPPEPVTVAALKRALAAACPGLAPLVPQLMIAIDSDYVGDEERLIPPGADVAAIPP